MTKEKIKPIICNMCGLSCQFKDSEEYGNHGLINATVNGGYCSTPGNGDGTLDDMSSYKFSLCEFCLDDMFSKFKHPPSVSAHGAEELEVYRPAIKRVVEDDWRRMKRQFFVEYLQRKAARNETLNGVVALAEKELHGILREEDISLFHFIQDNEVNDEKLNDVFLEFIKNTAQIDSFKKFITNKKESQTT